MGLVGSKDETGTVVLSALPPGFLDAKGKALRDELDGCLQHNMWFFSVAGLLVTVPVCIRFRTERPFFVAAVTCPLADMYYGTLRCKDQNEAFRAHYKQLQAAFNQPLLQQQREQQREQEQQEQQQLQQGSGQLRKQQQQQLQGGGPWRPPPEDASLRPDWQPPKARHEDALLPPPPPPPQQQQQHRWGLLSSWWPSRR